MIPEIFKEKVAEQRLAEQEANKRKLELIQVLKKAETDIETLLEKAPASAFNIPSGAYCAIVISLPEGEKKGSFTKEYAVFTGYELGDSMTESEFGKLEHIGDITLQFEHIVNAVNLSNLFKDIAKLHEDTTNNLLYFIFKDSKVE